MWWLWYSLGKPYCELETCLSFNFSLFPSLPPPPSLTLCFSCSLPLKITDPRSKMYLNFYNNYTSKCFLSKFDSLWVLGLMVLSLFYSQNSHSPVCPSQLLPSSSMWSHHIYSSVILSTAHCFPLYCVPSLSPRTLASTDSGSNSLLSHSNLPFFQFITCSVVLSQTFY